MNASGVSLMPRSLRLLLERRAFLLELRDVGFVVLRDVRHVDPARVQPRARDLLDARQRLGFDAAVLREIDGRHRGQRAGRTRPPPCMISLTNALTSSASHAALRAGAAHAAEIDAELARELAHGRARMRFAERRRRAATAALRAGAAARGAPAWRLGRGRRRARLRRAGAAARRAAARAARLEHEQRHRRPKPCSPTATLSSSTRPASGDGTSMLAFSVSSVTSPCSAATSSPGFTRIVDDLDAREVAEIRHDDGPRRAGAAAAAPQRASFGCRTVRSSSGRVSAARLAAAPRASAGSSDAITLPAETRSPAFTLSCADLAGGRRRNVHRRLVGLERDEALLRRHGVARLDENFDDLYVGKVTKIGYDDFHG